MEKHDMIFNNKSTGSEPNSVGSVTRRILRMDGNTVKLSIVSLVCILVGVMVLVVSFLPILMFSYETEVVETPLLALISLISITMFLCGVVLLFMPCITGVLYFARKTVDGGKPKFIEILSPFTNGKRYASSLMLPAVIILRAIIIILPLAGGIMNLPIFYDMALQMTFTEILADSAFILCLTILATCVGAYFSSFLFFVPYLVVSKKNRFFASILESVRMSHKKRLDITRHILSHSGNMLLALLSFMVLWIIVAAPRMLVSYFVYCDSIFEDDCRADYE